MSPSDPGGYDPQLDERASACWEPMFALKEEEVADLTRRLATAHEHGWSALVEMKRESAEKLTLMQSKAAVELAKKEEQWKVASIAAEASSVARLTAAERELFELRAAHDAEVAEMKSEHAKELKDLVEKLHRKQKAEERAAKGEEGANNARTQEAEKEKRKEKDPAAAARAKLDSWEIANLGRHQIELVHTLTERVERLVAIAESGLPKQVVVWGAAPPPAASKQARAERVEREAAANAMSPAPRAVSRPQLAARPRWRRRRQRPQAGKMASRTECTARLRPSPASCRMATRTTTWSSCWRV